MAFSRDIQYSPQYRITVSWNDNFYYQISIVPEDNEQGPITDAFIESIVGFIESTRPGHTVTNTEIIKTMITDTIL